MVSQAKIQANRQNAKKSTGPKSANGRQRTRFNAVKFGIYATSRVLPTEDLKAYEELTVGLIEEFEPRGKLAVELIDQLVANFIRLQRLEHGEYVHLRHELYEETRAREYRAKRANGDQGVSGKDIETMATNARGHPEPADYETALIHYIYPAETQLDLYGQVERRRRALMQDIIRIYKVLAEMRDGQLKTIDARPNGESKD
jgi:hypothetical protein